MNYGGDWVSSAKSPKHAPVNRRALQHKTSGRVVGTISVQSDGFNRDGVNLLEIAWTVDRSRKDLNGVLEQGQRTPCLPRYPQQLFDSCFKLWKE